MAAPREKKLRVIVIEDEGLFRDLLCRCLSQSPRLEVVGNFADGKSALARAVALRPRVAIVDINLGDSMNGVQVGRLLRRQITGVGIVLLSNYNDASYLSAVPEQEIGGWSYLLKKSVSDVMSLVRAVEGAAAGYLVLDSHLVRRSQPKHGGLLRKLTPRQIEILQLIAQGFSNGGIAELLGVSLKTVENQINFLYFTLGIEKTQTNFHPRVKAVLTYLRESCPV